MSKPTGKVLQILGVILLVEGISVLLLFSYVGLLIGFASLLLGVLLTLLFYDKEIVSTESAAPPGVRFIDVVSRLIGGKNTFSAVGVTVIALVTVYNLRFSPNPSFGDFDTITLLFGGVLLIYPFIPQTYRFESDFALLFTGLVFSVLVVPQVVLQIGGEGSSVDDGGWYVHYMLAAPFAAMLDLVGVPATSSGSLVTLQFVDGSIHTLSISMYCAGLYSFSIFLSAFTAFVLVHEPLRNSVLIAVLLLGLAIAYAGNLVRMTVIGVVGYFHGIDALMWAHQNAGWIIFLSWSSVFWWIVLSRLSGEAQMKE